MVLKTIGQLLEYGLLQLQLIGLVDILSQVAKKIWTPIKLDKLTLIDLILKLLQLLY